MPRDPKGRDLYERVIADLRARRDQIDRAISAIEVVKSVSPIEEPRNAVPMRSNAFLGRTVVEAAKELLAAHGRPLRNAEIAEGIMAGGVQLKSANPANTIGAILMRRWKQVGDVSRVGRGLWTLAERRPETDRNSD